MVKVIEYRNRSGVQAGSFSQSVISENPAVSQSYSTTTEYLTSSVRESWPPWHAIFARTTTPRPSGTNSYLKLGRVDHPRLPITAAFAAESGFLPKEKVDGTAVAGAMVER